MCAATFYIKGATFWNLSNFKQLCKAFLSNFWGCFKQNLPRPSHEDIFHLYRTINSLAVVDNVSVIIFIETKHSKSVVVKKLATHLMKLLSNQTTIEHDLRESL